MYFRKQESSSSADTAQLDVAGMAGLHKPDRFTPPPNLRMTPPPPSDRPVSLGSPPTQKVDVNAPLAPIANPPAILFPAGVDIEMQPVDKDGSFHGSASTHG